MLMNQLAVLLSNVMFFSLRISNGGGSFPSPLSAEEEFAALNAMAGGDAAARNTLIEHNLRLVAHVIKKYYSSRDDQDDLISIGTIGLIKAISSFDPQKGARLATYAARCIENEVRMYFRSMRKQSMEVSLSEPIDSDKDGNSLSLIDVISCDDNLLDDIELSDRQQILRRSIPLVLDCREQEIITLRYGLGGVRELTQREVSEKCGISRSYVSRIEKKALCKLSMCFSDKK